MKHVQHTRIHAMEMFPKIGENFKQLLVVCLIEMVFAYKTQNGTRVPPYSYNERENMRRCVEGRRQMKRDSRTFLAFVSGTQRCLIKRKQHSFRLDDNP